MRDATTIKAISDAVVKPNTTLDDEVGDAIDLALGLAADEGDEKAFVTLEAIINKLSTEIIQPRGNLNLNDVVIALESKGFRTSSKPKASGRVGGMDRVTITIAW